MSEEQTTQPVVEDPDAGATPPVEDTSAQDEPSLEDMLGQFNQATSGADNQPAPATETDPSQLVEVVNELKQFRQEQTNNQFQADLTEAIDRVRGDLDPEVFDDDFVESYLDARAKKNPEFAQAWTNRHTNKRQFGSILDRVHRDLAKYPSRIADRQSTEDREAVTAAVTGATDKAPEAPAPDYSGMSNAEFRKAMKKDYGFTPQV